MMEKFHNTKWYRTVPFQIKYKKDLNVIEESEVTDYKIVDHFAVNGYENLYITQEGFLKTVVTLDDYVSGKTVKGIDRIFIQEHNKIHSKESIEQFFIDYPYVDRITIVDNGILVCEIDSLIELPLQNGKAKNIMTLRYFDIFYNELTEFFSKCQKILIIGSEEIGKLFIDTFPFLHVDIVTDIKKLYSKYIIDEYEYIIDFFYSKNIRSTMGFNPPNLLSMSKLLMKFAINKLQKDCLVRGVYTKFYRLQNYKDLTCLNEYEYNNCINRIKTGRLVLDEVYVRKFIASEKELCFLKRRNYHSSLRIDDGYCFCQDRCNEEYVKVENGVRCIGLKRSVSENSVRVMFFGPCTVYGFLVPDDETIPSLVFEKAQKENLIIDVVNYGGIHGYNELNAIMMALRCPVKRGDVLVFFDTFDDLEISEYPNIQQAYKWFNCEKPKEDIWFFDFPGHCNRQANEVIAEHIYNDIKKDICKNLQKDKRSPLLEKSFDKIKYLKLTHSSCIRFFEKYNKVFFKNAERKKIGAIIIPDSYDTENALALCEKVIKYCDALYVFKFNSNLKYINMSKKFFEVTETVISNKEVRILQLGYFFDYTRYLSNGKTLDSCEESKFIEKIIVDIILKNLKVNVRFVSDEEKIMNLMSLKKLYENAQIDLAYILNMEE